MYSYFSTGWKMSSCDFETSGLDQFFRALDQILMTKPFDLNWWQQLGKSFRELFCNTGTLSYIKVHIDHVRAAPLEARATVFEMIWSVFKVKLEKRLSAKKVFNFFMQRNIFILLGCMTRFQAFTRLTTYRKKTFNKNNVFQHFVQSPVFRHLSLCWSQWNVLCNGNGMTKANETKTAASILNNMEEKSVENMLTSI